MFTMKIYVSTFLLVGIVMNVYVEGNIQDDMRNICHKYLDESIHPTVQFFNLMSTVISKTGKHFNMWTEDSTYEDMRSIIQEFCSEDEAKEGNCIFKELLFGKFVASILVTEGPINELICLQDTSDRIVQEGINGVLTSLKFTVTQESNLKEFCGKLINQLSEISHCPEPSTTTAIPDCTSVCNNIKPVTTQPAKVTEKDSSVLQENPEEAFQTSAVVIASVISFIAGITCALIIVFIVHYLRNRQQASGTKEEGVSTGDTQLNRQVVSSYEDLTKRDDMSYENLKKKMNVAESSTDHVYLGLNTHSDPDNKQVTTNRYENVTQTGVDSNPQRIIDKKEDNVYNTLEINTHTEDTYTGLTERENENQHQQSNDQDISETQNNSSEAHYFILHDETNCNRNNRNSESNVQEKTNEVSENKADNTTTKENEYFVLQKVDHFDSKIPEETHNDENSVDDSECAYHILEKE